MAADVEHIASISRSVCEPLRCYGHVVQANETTVLSPGVLSAKYYAPGVGLIGEDTLSGDPYSYRLISFKWPGASARREELVTEKAERQRDAAPGGRSRASPGA